MPRMFVRLIGLLVLVHILTGRSAEAQPCYTCRAEKCPLDKTMPEWCGKKGADPLQRAQKPKAAPASITGLSIVSEPPGAGVRRDSPEGELLGATPLTGLALSPGRHRFVLQRDGYEAGLLEVEARQSNEQFALILKKQPSTEPLAVPVRPIAEPHVSDTPTTPPPVQVAPAVQATLSTVPPLEAAAVQSKASSPPAIVAGDRARSRRRVILAAVFGGVAVVALGAGIAFTVMTHDPGSRIYSSDMAPDGQLARQCSADGQNYECYLNLAPAYGAAYGVAALGTIGLAVTLGLK